MTGFDPELASSELSGLIGGLSVGSALVHGGQGAVFGGVHDDHGDVVLKVVLPQFEERSRREIDVLRVLEHSNVVRLLDHGYVGVRGETCPYTLTRRVVGRDIRAMLLAGDLLAEDQARAMVLGIAGALDSLWAEEIVHRDVKPGNIVLGDDGVAVLIDLGIARHLTRSDLTTYGGWLGTSGFMSPEQAAGEKMLTVRADIFSLGVTAYLAVAGTHPFGDQSAIAAGVSPVPLPGVSNLFASTIGSMLQLRPIARPTAREVIEVLT